MLKVISIYQINDDQSVYIKINEIGEGQLRKKTDNR